MKKIAKYQLIVLFGALLLLPIANSAFQFVRFDRPDENRTFRDSLTIDINKLDAFPAECEEYFNVNFSFRTPLLSAYHDLKFNYFNVSPHPEQTVLGKNNWYFLAGQELDDFEGRRQLSREQLDKIKQEWTKRKAYFDEKGITYYWMIAPAKHDVYSEQLPFYVVQSNQSNRIDQVKDHLKKDFPDFIVDVREALIRAKSKKATYYRLDNHWSDFGAYTSYLELLKKIQRDFPTDSAEIPLNFTWEKRTAQWGIHYTTLGINALTAEAPFSVFQEEKGVKVQNYGFVPPSEDSYEWEYEQRFMNKDTKSKLRILVIRDSFGDAMLPFVKETFSETVFIFDFWQYQLNADIIDIVKPDIVVYENISKFIEVFAGEDKNADL